MKTSLAIVLAAFLAFAANASAAGPMLVSTITGTTTIEKDLGGGVTKIKVVPLDNKRIYAEFGVSPKDYILVVESTHLLLTPKAAMSPLPDIPVMDFTVGLFTVHSTKPNVTKGTGAVTCPATMNIFNNLVGIYTFTLTVPPTPGAIAKAVNQVTAAGATNPGPNQSLIMQFKLTTGKLFVAH